MFENISQYKIKPGRERGFGLIFATVFLIIGLYPFLQGQDTRFWAFIVALIFLFFGIFLPKTLIVPNKLWFKFGILLGAIVSPVIMGIIFFLAVTPTGIIMRLLGKDLLRQKLNESKKSYWIQKINLVLLAAKEMQNIKLFLP